MIPTVATTNRHRTTMTPTAPSSNSNNHRHDDDDCNAVRLFAASSSSTTADSFDDGTMNKDNGGTNTNKAAALLLGLDDATTTTKISSDYIPTRHPDEYNLYMIPANIQPVYRPLPWIIKSILGILSTLLVATTCNNKNPRLVWTYMKKYGAHPGELGTSILMAITNGQHHQRLFASWKIWRILVVAGIRIFFVFTIMNVGLQELLLRRPNRISTRMLQTKYSLPSPLSHYATLPTGQLDENYNNNQSIHWLEYRRIDKNTYHNQNETITTDPSSISTFYDAIYVNHGFGASSLSWLPVMYHLAEHLNANIVVGHDAPGFGFTDRSTSLDYYSVCHSAKIGLALLRQTLQSTTTRSSNTSSSSERPQQQKLARRVLLMGHSLGALTTLRMARQLAKENPSMEIRVVLVAPALGLRRQKQTLTTRKKVLRPFLWKLVRKPVLATYHGLGGYALRRLVGAPQFWRKGLSLAWGDAQRLSDSDVLRFQWPSIGKGWERGLLEFTRAQTIGTTTTTTAGDDDNDDEAILADDDDDDDDDDTGLLDAVMKAPNVGSVDVILGSKDRIIAPVKLRSFLKKFPQIRIIEMDGLGHDPFEENVDYFVHTVKDLLSIHLCSSEN